MERTLIAPGVHLSCDPASKFNRCRISIHFAFPAQRKTATAHALLPLVMERGYADCPDMTRLTKKLAKLYGADLTVDARPMGCNHNLCVSVTGIKDAFALEGDALTAAQKKAQEILDKAKADPDSFDDLWKENNTDTAQPDTGYYFTEGDMVDEYYQAVVAMEPGAINEELVYYKGYGWFIIEKLDLDEKALTDTAAYLNNSGEGDESTIKTAIGQQMVQDKMDEIMEAMEVETTEEYDKITAYNVNTYLGFDAEAYVEQGSGSGSGAEAAVGSAG